MKPESVQKILDRNNGGRDGLISVLEDIQAKYTYLPETALRMVSEKTGRSLVDIYGVATFYRSFSLKPRGRHLICACLGTACHVRRAPAVAEELQRQLGIKSGETTPDKEFTFETVNCLGACALGPIVVVDGKYYSNVAPAKVSGILEAARGKAGKGAPAADGTVFPLEVNCARCNHSLMDPSHPIDSHPSIRVTVSFERKHGWLRLSCLYGSHNVESKDEIPEDTMVNFFCPHCHAEMVGASKCPECGAPMVPMIVRRGGMVQVCSRHGCKGHTLDLNGSAS